MKTALFTILIAAATSAIMFYALGTPKAGISAPKAETAYERVMRTGTLRCGYGIWPLYTKKDPNTGEISGFFPDYVEAMAELLSLKVEWVEETGWGEMPAALDAGRFDVFCSGTWRTGARARLVDYISPISYQPVVAIVRKDDNRFKGNLSLLNNKDVIFMQVDGTAEAETVKVHFPKASMITLPSLNGAAELFTSLETKKVDAILTSPAMLADYAKNNAGKLKELEDVDPIALQSESLVIVAGEHTLRQMLETATQELINSGKIDKIITKHEPYPGVIYRPQPPYKKVK